MIRCEPDIVRFCDPEAMENDYPIHTVELSDDRSVSQFVTLWFKGKNEQIEELKRRGLDDHHNRDVYHRGPAWLPAQFPGKHRHGWSHHSHIDLERPPLVEDLEPYADAIPPVIRDEIENHLRK